MVKMSKEARRIYNEHSRKIGRPLLIEDDDAIDTFQQEVDEVTPYTTGLQTTVDDPDYAKNIKQELDSISTSTQYLFNAVSAAQEAYSNAKDAASDAYDAQQTANDAYNQALQNAKDIVTLNGDISDINITIGTMQTTIEGQAATISGIQENVATNTGDISSLTGTVTTQGEQIDDNTAGVQNYYDVWGVKDTTGEMVRGAAFISNESSPGDAAFIVDANFAVVNGDTNTPVLTIDATSGELVFNGTVPGLDDAIQEAEDAYTAAQTAQNDAISALGAASATSSATANFTGDETHRITIKAWTQADKDSGIASDRQITLLPVVVGGIGGSSAHEASLKVVRDGTTLFDKNTGYMSDGYSGYLAYSDSFLAGVDDDDHYYEVTMHNGGLSDSARTQMTVLATRNYSSGFVIA